jgi:hypothetical protein
MQDLSALTPPLLMAGVVVIAIVAFLRHEMGRGHSRRDRSAREEEMSASELARAAEPECHQRDDSAARETTRHDS